MTLLEYYQQQCQQGIIQSDPEQLAALDAFQRVLNDLKHHQKSSGLFRIRKPKPMLGLYVYGGVGIGKTLMMDCFIQCLPFPQKLRLHFHAFMQMIHRELKQQQGVADPLAIIAKDLANRYRVICLDEFIVNDIVDAMLLARLLQAFIERGICFVTTSNTMPDELYKNGLQRTSFLPAIALIKQHLQVLHVGSQQDYRLLQITKAGVFFTPDDDHAEAAMQTVFERITHGHEVLTDKLEIHDRPVTYKVRTHEIIWFDFTELCTIPRSQQDYLALAADYKIIFLSHVPMLKNTSKNIIYLFIRLIDVLYDAKVTLILSSAIQVEDIFDGVSGIAEVARIRSRLIEMRSSVVSRLFLS